MKQNIMINIDVPDTIYKSYNELFKCKRNNKAKTWKELYNLLIAGYRLFFGKLKIMTI